MQRVENEMLVVGQTQATEGKTQSRPLCRLWYPRADLASRRLPFPPPTSPTPLKSAMPIDETKAALIEGIVKIPTFTCPAPLRT